MFSPSYVCFSYVVACFFSSYFVFFFLFLSMFVLCLFFLWLLFFYFLYFLSFPLFIIVYLTLVLSVTAFVFFFFSFFFGLIFINVSILFLFFLSSCFLGVTVLVFFLFLFFFIFSLIPSIARFSVSLPINLLVFIYILVATFPSSSSPSLHSIPPPRNPEIIRRVSLSTIFLFLVSLFGPSFPPRCDLYLSLFLWETNVRAAPCRRDAVPFLRLSSSFSPSLFLSPSTSLP